MESETLDKNIKRQIEAKRLLYPNYISLGDWKFMNTSTGAVRDLSAADLTQIERIESENLFRI